MDILKTTLEWTKAEIFSSSFFVLLGVLFVMASFGFRYLGKTDLAKAFTTPTIVAGILLLIIGVGLVYSNITRLNNFEASYAQDASVFITSEIARAEKTMAEYTTIVFKVIPIIIMICALLIVLVDRPTWRAISITTMAMMVVILLVDSNANARMASYYDELILFGK